MRKIGGKKTEKKAIKIKQWRGKKIMTKMKRARKSERNRQRLKGKEREAGKREVEREERGEILCHAHSHTALLDEPLQVLI